MASGTWTDPNTESWNTGTVPTQSVLRAQIRDNLLALRHPIAYDSVDKTVANTVTETTLLNATMTIPAGELGANGKFLFHCEGTIGGNNTATMTIRFKIGGVTILTISHPTIQNTANMPFELYLKFWNRNATNNQWLQGVMRGQSSHSISAMTNDTDTVDTTASMSLDVTAQWSGTGAANTITASVRAVTVGQLI